MPANRHQYRVFGSTTAAFCLASAVALAALAGCSYSPPYSCTKVAGKITYEDGSLIPAQRIRLTFHSQAKPIDSRTPPKNGLAEVDVKTGRFDGVTTFSYNDGIIGGEHKVEVQCIGGNGKLIPDEYADANKTPLKVQSDKSPFDIKVPKPGSARSGNR